MDKPTRLVIAAGVVAIVLVGPLLLYAFSQGERRILVAAIGLAALIVPSLLPKRITSLDAELWLLLPVAFVTFGLGAGLVAFGVGVAAVMALAIGVIGGVGWAGYCLMQRRDSVA